MHSHAKQHIKYMNTLVQRVCTYAADDKWTLNFEQWVSANAHENNMSNSYTFLCIGYARMHMHGVIWVRYQVYNSSKVDGILIWVVALFHWSWGATIAPLARVINALYDTATATCISGVLKKHWEWRQDSNFNGHCE